jgi:hypothetical protein
MTHKKELSEQEKQVLAEACAGFAIKHRIPVDELLEFIATLLMLMMVVEDSK